MLICSFLNYFTESTDFIKFVKVEQMNSKLVDQQGTHINLTLAFSSFILIDCI